MQFPARWATNEVVVIDSIDEQDEEAVIAKVRELLRTRKPVKVSVWGERDSFPVEVEELHALHAKLNTEQRQDLEKRVARFQQDLDRLSGESAVVQKHGQVVSGLRSEADRLAKELKQ